MPNAWMATKSHFCEAMSSIAARCLTASSWPSNQVTSTLKSLPQYSAACLPWAHQVACSPAFENAALSGFSERPASLAIAEAMSGLKPNPPNSAAAPAAEAWISLRRSVETFVFASVIDSSLRRGVPRRSSSHDRPCHRKRLRFNRPPPDDIRNRRSPARLALVSWSSTLVASPRRVPAPTCGAGVSLRAVPPLTSRARAQKRRAL